MVSNDGERFFPKRDADCRVVVAVESFDGLLAFTLPSGKLKERAGQIRIERPIEMFSDTNADAGSRV